MVSGGEEKPINPKPNSKPLIRTAADTKHMIEKNKKRRSGMSIDNKTKKKKTIDDNNVEAHFSEEAEPVSASKESLFLINQFESANGAKLSSLELESFNSRCIFGEDFETIGKQLMQSFGPKWKEVLCKDELVEGKVEPGSPVVLFISTSAVRCIELLWSVRSFTKECNGLKLFSKHIKVEEQVSLLQNRVNFASGTPNRIKKLFDIEALGLSRLAVIVLDMQTDKKGYSLFTLPQVRDEFWDLYKNYFHQRLLQGDVRVCLFGPMPSHDRKLSSKSKMIHVKPNKQHNVNL